MARDKKYTTGENLAFTKKGIGFFSFTETGEKSQPKPPWGRGGGEGKLVLVSPGKPLVFAGEEQELPKDGHLGGSKRLAWIQWRKSLETLPWNRGGGEHGDSLGYLMGMGRKGKTTLRPDFQSLTEENVLCAQQKKRKSYDKRTIKVRAYTPASKRNCH